MSGSSRNTPCLVQAYVATPNDLEVFLTDQERSFGAFAVVSACILPLMIAPPSRFDYAARVTHDAARPSENPSGIALRDETSLGWFSAGRG